MLKKIYRISNQRLILKLSRQGRNYSTKWFVFKFLPSGTPESKFALSISKKIVSRAVNRNKLKRQLYESLRSHLVAIKSPIVCLIFIKKEIPEKRRFSEIDPQLQRFVNSLTFHV